MLDVVCTSLTTGYCKLIHQFANVVTFVLWSIWATGHSDCCVATMKVQIQSILKSQRYENKRKMKYVAQHLLDVTINFLNRNHGVMLFKFNGELPKFSGKLCTETYVILVRKHCLQMLWFCIHLVAKRCYYFLLLKCTGFYIACFALYTYSWRLSN